MIIDIVRALEVQRQLLTCIARGPVGHDRDEIVRAQQDIQRAIARLDGVAAAAPAGEESPTAHVIFTCEVRSGIALEGELIVDVPKVIRWLTVVPYGPTLSDDRGPSLLILAEVDPDAGPVRPHKLYTRQPASAMTGCEGAFIGVVPGCFGIPILIFEGLPPMPGKGE